MRGAVRAVITGFGRRILAHAGLIPLAGLGQSSHTVTANVEVLHSNTHALRFGGVAILHGSQPEACTHVTPSFLFPWLCRAHRDQIRARLFHLFRRDRLSAARRHDHRGGIAALAAGL